MYNFSTVNLSLYSKAGADKNSLFWRLSYFTDQRNVARL